MTETQHYLGRDVDGTRYYAQIRLDEADQSVEFTDHTHGSLLYSFAASGFAIEKGRREAAAGGQICETFTQIVDLADGWAHSDINSLVEIWREWHLNNTNAWSDEQRAQAKAANFDYDTLRDLTDSAGYKYGSKWLARQLPQGVVDEVKRLQDLPFGSVPDTY